mmetsp:Transcript_25869/g.56756  ORF Transcript_25869/g.56756 Transcript_25869/m.56756 type:complete len:489 (-) Transcript_25869:1364-2830(-)
MMTREKVMADLRKELASKEEMIKAKDETIDAQLKALQSKDETLQSKDETLQAKDDLIESLRQQLAAASRPSFMGKLLAFVASIWDAMRRAGKQQRCPPSDGHDVGRRSRCREDDFTQAKPLEVPNRSSRGEVRRLGDMGGPYLSPYVPRSGRRQQQREQMKSARSSSPPSHDALATEGAVSRTLVPNRSSRGAVRHMGDMGGPYISSNVPRSVRRQQQREQREQAKSTARSSSPPPHDALVTEDTVSRTLSFLGLKDYATGARICRAWSGAAKSVDNASSYWRDVAHCRWPDWAAMIEAELGTKCDFKSACKEKLRDEDHQLIDAWKKHTIPQVFSDEYDAYNAGVPEGVPKISWLSHHGHITGSLDALSMLSHNTLVPAPIFQRYENAALAMYEDRDRDSNCGGFKNLLPVPSNVSNSWRHDHRCARAIVKVIFFKSDGSLMDEKPKFSYRDEVALYFAGTYEQLSPTQILTGIVKLRSMETAGAIN